jgi:hypothetical protein
MAEEKGVSQRKREFNKISLVLVGFLCISGAARANIFVIPDRVTQNPTDIIDWGQLGVATTTLASPQIVGTFNGNTVEVSNVGGAMERLDEGNGWGGNFDFGETLLWTHGANGPMTLQFVNPVSSVGFDIQDVNFGRFLGILHVYDTSNSLLGSLYLQGLSNSLENGSALFMGLGDTAGDTISSITIDTTSDDFSIDDVSLTTTPEPDFYRVVTLGLLALVGAKLRSLRKHGNKETI